jgi:multidrug resistance efflux pump
MRSILERGPFARISRGEPEPVQAPLRDWLALHCHAIAGAEAGVALLGASEHAPGAARAEWPAPGAATPRLLATLALARERGEPVTQTASEAGNLPGTALHIALPIERDGAVVGAAALSVRGAAPGDAKSIAERLALGLRGLALLLDVRTERDRLADALTVASSLLDHEALAAAAHAAAAELAHELGCERVAVGLRRRGRTRVVALSSDLRFAEESDVVAALVAAMDEALEQDAVLDLPAPPGAQPHALHAHTLLARESGDTKICSVPLTSRGRAVGVLTFEWSGNVAADGAQRTRAREAALLCGPILDLLVRAEAGVFARAQASVARFAERHFGANHALAKGALAAAAALLAILAVVPAPYRVSARATLEGRVQRALVAGVGGYIAEANARAGDLIEAGSVLATLDDRDLRLERRKHESQKGQLENEYRQALAAGDRSRVSILRAQIEKASAELELVDEELGRTRIVAPFGGIVLEGDLEHSLGSPVEQGEVLFEIAPLDGYRIIVEVDGRDIADVAPGQTGQLALSAVPGRSLPLLLERITPISTTKDGRSYFRAEAALTESLDALRPGMEGVAKIDSGRRRLLWIWTHGLLDWLRLGAWSLVP